MGEKNRTGIFVKPHQAAIIFDPVEGRFEFALPRGVKLDGSVQVPRGMATMMAFMMEISKGDKAWSNALIDRWFKPSGETISLTELPPVPVRGELSPSLIMNSDGGNVKVKPLTMTNLGMALAAGALAGLGKKS